MKCLRVTIRRRAQVAAPSVPDGCLSFCFSIFAIAPSKRCRACIPKLSLVSEEQFRFALTPRECMFCFRSAFETSFSLCFAHEICLHIYNGQCSSSEKQSHLDSTDKVSSFVITQLTLQNTHLDERQKSKDKMHVFSLYV